MEDFLYNEICVDIENKDGKSMERKMSHYKNREALIYKKFSLLSLAVKCDSYSCIKLLLITYDYMKNSMLIILTKDGIDLKMISLFIKSGVIKEQDLAIKYYEIGDYKSLNTLYDNYPNLEI